MSKTDAESASAAVTTPPSRDRSRPVTCSMIESPMRCTRSPISARSWPLGMRSQHITTAWTTPAAAGHSQMVR